MTNPDTAKLPTYQGSRLLCSCGSPMLHERREQGEMRHSYYFCERGHKWVHAQVGWEAWEWDGPK